MKNQQTKIRTSDFVQDPYSFYDNIRSTNPIYKGNFFRYPGWYVTGYEEANLILKDIRFQNRIPLPETTKKYEVLKNVQKQMMLYKNQPDHNRLRKIVSERFTPRALEQLIPIIKETANGLFCHVANQKRMNVISDFAFPLASLVIANMLGVPKQEKDQFRQWALTLIQTIDHTRSKESLAKGNDTTLEMIQYFQQLIQKRKQDPQDDLISLLLSDNQNGEPLTDAEIISTCILLVIAGHETTVNLIANSVYCFLTHPTQYDKLQANPLLLDSAIQEILRYESPTQMTARIAAEDLTINQTEIKKGDHVYLLIGAANRDPKKFINANSLDITRSPNPHLSFGSGIHFCLGATLAKIEAQAAIQTILEHTQKIKFETTEIEWRNLVGFRALKELPIIFE
ncbi:cytochrome P450 [Halalkalibacter alkaliphilus]|uniref:Cytochrome P450 n=1 Tax=Halalkalibacter alkaliphilus TaxID=2917993 RepID=A0A9X1ZU69_9BACI|nr:cytochrome P450 [Halalkalibacter alkaliphilus]MCL7745594.1 cytochrome P450 [Halalkalibacter alkaliphilus]